MDAEHVEVVEANQNDEVQRLVQPLSAKENEEVLMTRGQRKINILWEITSSLIALSVTWETLYVVGKMALTAEGETQVAAFVLLSTIFSSVITAYIAKVNHSKIGGVKSGDPGR